MKKPVDIHNLKDGSGGRGGRRKDYVPGMLGVGGANAIKKVIEEDNKMNVIENFLAKKAKTKAGAIVHDLIESAPFTREELVVWMDANEGRWRAVHPGARGADYLTSQLHKGVDCNRGRVARIEYLGDNPGANVVLYKDEGFFGIPPASGGPLKERFVMPPYSTWNTRDGDWQRRRRAWLATGIKSEEGRAGKLTFNIPLVLKEGRSGNRIKSQTSIFDPVVCELAYGWWCPPGGRILDSFAGGSVRGLVASMLGFEYFGIELRAEQVEANRAQATPATTGKFKPRWKCGDAVELTKTSPEVDFLFSCPPYGNLEVYSDEKGDLSNMTHAQFLVGYRQVIADAVARLRDNRFACFVISNYRSKDKDGKQMHDFKGQTIAAFEDAGAMFYNDIILINSVGTGAMRANGTFVRGNRKVVKCHQDVLVFVKGDPAKAAALIPADSGVNTGEGATNTEESNEPET